MFCLHEPSERRIAALLSSQNDQPLSYSPAGITASAISESGRTVDHNRICLGKGPVCFNGAVSAIKSWKMFRLGWVRAFPNDLPIVTGQAVAVIVRHLGFWSINPCRIVYVVDEVTNNGGRYGFAYGTLPAHAERGEERFTVEWNRLDDSVWYDIRAVSKPGLIGAIAYPYTRHLQKRFAADSMKAMAEAVQTL